MQLTGVLFIDLCRTFGCTLHSADAVEPEDACQTKNKNTPRGARTGLYLAPWHEDPQFMPLAPKRINLRFPDIVQLEIQVVCEIFIKVSDTNIVVIL